MMKNCIICGAIDNKIIYNNYPGYIEGSVFDIHKCNSCDTHFIIPEKDIKYIYDKIYSNTNTSGYDRYYNYAQTIKKINDPLKYLAYNESTYFPVYEFLRNKKNLKILEVGCGYGYLSYSLNKAGFNVKAIDIAEKAIQFAKENLGNFYYQMNINEFSNQANEKFDLIIATEVIEHLEDPNDFIENCIRLLDENGHILVTTPNKDYSKPNAIWQTDLPPVHIYWIGLKGIKRFAERHKLEIKVQDFSNYNSSYENRLVKYFVSRKESIGIPILTKEGTALIKSSSSFLHNKISQIVHKTKFIRSFSNHIFNLFDGREITLGVILKRVSK